MYPFGPCPFFRKQSRRPCYHARPVAFLFNLDLSELAIIVIGAVIVFGKNLPEVAMKGAAQFMRLRRQLSQMWRDAGLEEELRKVRRDLDSAVPKLPLDQSFFDTPATPSAPAQQAGDLGSSLKPAGDISYLEPDEDPDERADWELESAYGPTEEEQRAVDHQAQLEGPDELDEPSDPAASDDGAAGEPEGTPKDESA